MKNDLKRDIQLKIYRANANGGIICEYNFYSENELTNYEEDTFKIGIFTIYFYNKIRGKK